MNAWLYGVRTRLLCDLLPRVARTGLRRVDGLELQVLEGVHDPAPLPVAAFTSLHRLAVASLPPGQRVLDLGSGTGVWALLAARAGHEVIATELTEPMATGVRQNAQRNGLRLEVLVGDLFAPVAAERFDVILFNPPFHDGTPESDAERAWVGGETVRRFLAEAGQHLRPGGRVLMQMPRLDQARYVSEFERWAVRHVASTWFPLVGSLELLELTATTT